MTNISRRDIYVYSRKSKKKKMLNDLSDIASYLVDAGFTDKADKIKAVMHALDGVSEQNIVDQHPIPDEQMNTANQGHEPGESPIGGGYSGLSVGEAQPADDEQNNIDMIAGVNGLVGNTSTSNMFQGLSDSYMYVGYEQLESPYR